jgi:hypothetical protein
MPTVVRGAFARATNHFFGAAPPLWGEATRFTLMIDHPSPMYRRDVVYSHVNINSDDKCAGTSAVSSKVVAMTEADINTFLDLMETIPQLEWWGESQRGEEHRAYRCKSVVRWRVAATTTTAAAAQ